MYDVLSLPGINELKGVPEFFWEKSDKIRNFPPAALFEKAIPKIFGELLENYPQHSAY